MPTGIYKRKVCSIKTKEKIGNANRGKKRTILQRKKISDSKKGKKLSDEHYENLSKNFKGEGNPFFGKKHSVDSKDKMSKSHFGMKKTWVVSPTKGKKLSILHRKHISEEHLKNKEKHPMWKGGIYLGNCKIRKSLESKLWRESVFKRDDFICQKCKERGGTLHRHHILNFAQYEDLRFDTDNGLTFCKSCHHIFHKEYGQLNNTRKQLIDFIGK